MPVLAMFYGITIRMYFGDHHPPHFHALYANYEALIRIADGTVMRGQLPSRARRLVEEWRILHRRELQAQWVRARAGHPVERIAPLD